jgi:hypothetical protein
MSTEELGMFIHFFHLVLAVFLIAAVLADVFYLRSPRSEAIAPRELIQGWRKKVGLTEMFLFLAVFGLGLTMWLPLSKAYPPHIFHTKMTLSVVFLVCAKVRMFRERKKGVQIGLTRFMGAVAVTILCLGAIGGLSG